MGVGPRRSGRVLATITVALTALVATALPAFAHGDDGTDPAAHAQEDLVGVPMSRIEAETAANARPLSKQQVAANQRVAAGSSPTTTTTTNARQVGSWSSVYDTPVVPVFQALLPSGKVLMWDSVGDDDPIVYANQSFTRAALWDPVKNTSRRVDLIGYNIFCSGFTQLADGNVLVAGGNVQQPEHGIQQTHLFNWQTETWSRGPDMSMDRWYPAVTALSDGQALILGGGPGTAEVYQNNGTLRELSGFSQFPYKLYPFLSVRPDGRVQQLGPAPNTDTIDTQGSGALQASQDRDGIVRTYASFATYDIGRSLVAGGGDLTEGGAAHVPTRTAVVVNTNGTGTSVQATGSMAFPRRQHNLTVLADGSVLATGGESTSTNLLVDLAHAVRNAERWDPSTGTWSTLAAAAKVRQYHSASLLLPDGRVLTGGGGVCGECVRAGYLEKNLEYFSPPYLYDSAGRAATRPQLSSVPKEMVTGGSFDIKALPLTALGVSKVGMVRLGAPTHGVDQGQRYVPLKFSKDLLGIHVTAPANGAIAPPGYYQLFVTANGVPSLGQMIKVVAPAAAAGSAGSVVTHSSGGCLDGAANGALTLRYCADPSTAQGVGQQWVRNGSDLSLRTRGGCVDLQSGLLGLFSSIRLDACRSLVSQRWVRYTDGTIRPANNAGACLQPAEVRDGAQIVLTGCNGSTLQRWP